MKSLCEVVLWCLLIAFCVAAVGCNTVEGIGRDIERAGEIIQDATQ
jgi:predicted small secreted protein